LSELAPMIAEDLVRLPTDWIDIMGTGSEWLHDVIDRAAVAIGRQDRVGDGIPMTAWHDDLRDMAAMIDFLRLGGLGGTDHKLVVVVGDAPSTVGFADGLSSSLA